MFLSKHFQLLNSLTNEKDIERFILEINELRFWKINNVPKNVNLNNKNSYGNNAISRVFFTDNKKTALIIHSFLNVIKLFIFNIENFENKLIQELVISGL